MYFSIHLKQLAAIFLMLLFTFNLFGYRLVFYFAQQHSDNTIERIIDNNQYADEDLTVIKIPLSVPYQTNQSNFERFDGEVDYNGVIYKYVKRKISDGNLILLCLPSTGKMHLETARNEFFKNATDLQNAGAKKSENSKQGVAKNMVSDYNHQNTEYSLALTAYFHKPLYYNNSFPLATAVSLSPEQPPELI